MNDLSIQYLSDPVGGATIIELHYQEHGGADIGVFEYGVVVTGSAQCSPSDEFDTLTGYRIALVRAFRALTTRLGSDTAKLAASAHDAARYAVVDGTDGSGPEPDYGSPPFESAYDAPDLGGRRCADCGCTDGEACTQPNGNVCSWVQPTLCSFCAALSYTAAARPADMGPSLMHGPLHGG